jgi:hypothetical protein
VVTVTVTKGLHAQEEPNETIWLVECDDIDVARRLTMMMAENKKFRQVMPLAGGAVTFAAPRKKGVKPYIKAIEKVAIQANIGRSVEVVVQ